MATKQRIHFKGAIHHVYGRGNNKQDIFFSDEDRRFFLNWLSIIKQEEGFNIFAYCLMTNHYHFLIETGDRPLSTIMGRLLTAYAQRVHRLRGTQGHVFQGRYGAKLCPRDSYFLHLLKYIHLNPVEAGLVRDPLEWPWSGHRDIALGTAGLVDQSLPLSYFAPNSEEARRRYLDFIRGPSILSPNIDIARPRSAREKPLLLILKSIAQEYQLTSEEFLNGSRRHHLTPAKRDFIVRAREAGYSQLEAANFLGCTNGALTQLLQRGKLNK